MNNLKPVRLRDLRTQAAFILKDLNSHSPNFLLAAEKIQRIPFYADKSIDWISEHSQEIRLKHAYAALALDFNFQSWNELKKTIVEKDCLYRPAAVGFIHAWFNDFDRAEAYHKKYGGFLLGFWEDIIVCGDEYIAQIGLDRYSSEWKQIGYNWMRPPDKPAFQILKTAAINNYLKINEG
jgi:hypothetical protein